MQKIYVKSFKEWKRDKIKANIKEALTGGLFLAGIIAFGALCYMAWPGYY